MAERTAEGQRGTSGWRVVVALVAAAAAGAGWYYYYGPGSVDPFVDVKFATFPVTLAPRVHLLGRLAPGAAYAIEASGGVILIDSGLEPDAASLLEQLGELGIDAKQVKAVFLTHVHGDHVLGARAIRQLSGAKVHAGEGDCDVLEAGGPREAYFSTFPMRGYGTHPTPIDVRLKGGEVYSFGDAKVECLATPGHTPGSTCYLVTMGRLKILFTGDVVSSLDGDIGTYSAYLAPRFRSDAREYLATLRKLREMSPPDLLLPGHPLGTGRPQSPRMTPDKYRGLLDRGIGDMEHLVARYETDGANFLDGSPKELLKGLHYLGDYAGRAVYFLIADSHRIVFDAPGDPAFFDFLTAQLTRLGVSPPQPTAVLLTSSDPEAAGGLGELVVKTKCAVAVSDAGNSEARTLCPPDTKFYMPKDLESSGWFPGKCVPLGGRGFGPQGYAFRWQDKLVLVSGRIPIKVTDDTVIELLGALRGPTGNVAEYVKGLRELKQLDPALWLPAVPVHGQNANLYGDEWSQTLDNNVRVLRQ